jgi:hypothetical protein
MSLLQLTRVSVGEVGVRPGDVKMLTTDNFATITAAGYLNGVGNQLPEVGLAPSDVVECLYSYNAYTDTGSLAYFQPVFSNGVITLTAVGNPGDVTLPVVSGNFSVFSGTTGLMHDAGFAPSDATKTKVVMAGSAVQVGYIAHFVDVTGTVDDTAGAVINAGTIQSGLSGTVGGFIAYPPAAANGFLELLAINAGGAFNTIISNSAMLQTSTISIPDPGATTAKFLLSALTGAGTQHITSGAFQVDAGGLLAGLSTGGTAGTLTLYPVTTGNGSLILSPVNAGGAFNTTISNGVIGQSSVITIPDPGAATSKFVLQDGNNTVLSVLNLKYGATPVAQVDPASCTITAVAGAANTSTITIQLKDGSGTNMARVIPFKVYLATSNTGLTLQSAASTGYSVTSGGVTDPTGSTTITQGLAAFSSASGGCVISLLDTGKGTGNLILMLENGFKASAAITAGSYG